MYEHGNALNKTFALETPELSQTMTYPAFTTTYKSKNYFIILIKYYYFCDVINLPRYRLQLILNITSLERHAALVLHSQSTSHLTFQKPKQRSKLFISVPKLKQYSVLIITRLLQSTLRRRILPRPWNTPAGATEHAPANIIRWPIKVIIK